MKGQGQKAIRRKRRAVKATAASYRIGSLCRATIIGSLWQLINLVGQQSLVADQTIPVGLTKS